MRIDLQNWIDHCINTLIANFKDNDDATMLIKCFVTQYELNALRIIENKAKFNENYNLHYYKQKIKNSVIKKEVKEVAFSGFDDKLDILFWPFQKSHFDVQIKIYNQLQNIKLSTAIVSHNHPVNSLINSQIVNGGIVINNLDHVWVDYKKIACYKELISSINNLPNFAYNNKSIRFKTLFLRSLNAWYWLYVQTTAIFNKMVSTYKPRVIFVGNSISLVGNLIGHLAQKKQIKACCIMHGRMNDYVQFGCFDYFYVFGKNDKNNMINNGISEEKIIISGSPKIDEFLKTNKNSPKKSSKYVLIALSGSGHSITEKHHIAILEMIYQVAAQLDAINFKFKLHRKDKIEYYKKLDTLKNTSIYKYGDASVSSNIYDWIKDANMLITGASTTALDAMLLNCAVITIDLFEHLKNVDFIEQNVSLHSTNIEQLLVNINIVLEQGEILKNHIETINGFIKGYYAQPEVGSLTLIENHIKSILK
ncbi:glycosyltransferase family protein [Aureibaculum conchae]|uniref:hypothetical protein n=1 Tax=Aureibaculum sp. 2308TA14-22 TaxID=3108392 RepID=UPI003399E039